MQLNMRYRLKFNRKIDKEKDFISLGGYAIKSRGRNFAFDFFRFEADVDKEHPEFLDTECTELDTNVYIESKELTEETLTQIESILELCCNTETTLAENLEPISLEELVFILPEDAYREIKVPDEVLKTVEFTHS